MSRPVRRGKACSICHKKKVKCDLPGMEESQPCTNCKLGGYTCRPHQTKRKRYALSPSPPRDIQRTPSRRYDYSATGNSYGTTMPTCLAEPEATSAPAETPLSMVTRYTPTSRGTAALPTSEVPVAEQSYIGRGEYIGGQVPFTEDTGDATSVTKAAISPMDGIPKTDVQILKLKNALEMPPRSVRQSLIDAFMERCHPWMPIVNRGWLDESNIQQKPSPLLLQAVLLAGSRVSSSRANCLSSEELYERTRTLFFHGHEKNTTLAVIAAILLQWWNPTGPEKFSISTSGFWSRICVELAYQVGLHREPPPGPSRTLRRRLWWTLVTRDNVISVGTGRPRTVNLADCDIRPPCLDDFPVPDTKASLFISYVAICRYMGDIAEAQRRHMLTRACRQHIEDGLYRWVRELPPELELMHPRNGAQVPAPYNFEARQLFVIYFASLILLHHSPSDKLAPAPAVTVNLMASSFVISIFDEFLHRDELRYLGPAFAFFALAIGLAQLSTFRYDSLLETAEHEFNILKLSLEELSLRWGSAHGALRLLTRGKNEIRDSPRLQGSPSPLTAETAVHFSSFGPDLCRLWHVGFPTSQRREATRMASENEQQNICTGDVTMTAAQSFAGADSTQYSAQLSEEDMAGLFPTDTDDMASFGDPLALVDHSWLFHNADMQRILDDARLV